MVPKFITHAASDVAQNKKDCVRVLGKGTRSKSKQHSPSASLSGSSNYVPATRLEKSGRGQCRLIVLKVMLHTFGKTITGCCLATKMFSLSQEKSLNWWKRQRNMISILLGFLLPRNVVLES